MKTYMAKNTDTSRQWWLVDAKGQVLGRLASRIARLLMGKHKPTYTPHVDGGDGVVVINASLVKLTGRKTEQKTYKFFSGYPGGLKESSFEKIHQDRPNYILRHAVKGMIPKNRLGRNIFTKLKIYTGSEHPHSAQQPKPIQLVK